MRVFVIDTRTMGLELQGGLIGVVGQISASSCGKSECVDTVSRTTSNRNGEAGV